METEVERVQDEATARNPEVALHVLVVVPAERRDAVAALEPESRERDRELLRPPRHLAVAVPVEALVRQAGDDLVVAEVRLDPPEQVRQRELEIHHLAAHSGNRNRPLSAQQRAGEDAVAHPVG